VKLVTLDVELEKVDARAWFKVIVESSSLN
jgi:hypothetical protein